MPEQQLATRGMTRQADGDYAVACPSCNDRNVVSPPARAGERVKPVSTCPHFRRSWLVAGDGRIRAEFAMPEGDA